MMQNTKTVIILIGLYLFGLSPVTAAQSLFDASGPRADQLDIDALLARANQGDARAAFLLGTRYASGRSAIRDDSLALRWFRTAADRGLAEAQYNLGIMYLNGRGTLKDPPQAARWIQMAAGQGLPRAQYRLGVMYAVGEGLDRDNAAALEWFTRAAEAGVAGAQYNAGLLHEYGQGTPVDTQAAARWYRLAADHGVVEAAERLAHLAPVATVPVTAGPADEPGAMTVPASTGPVDTGEQPTDALSTPAAEPRGDWLRGQDPGHYTVQVMAGDDPRAMARYIRRHGLDGQAAYVPTPRGSTPSYTLVYGSFAAFADARRALAALPEEVRVNGAFVRRIGVLQDRLPAAVTAD